MQSNCIRARILFRPTWDSWTPINQSGQVIDLGMGGPEPNLIHQTALLLSGMGDQKILKGTGHNRKMEGPDL